MIDSKGRDFGCMIVASNENATPKDRKAGASSRTPDAVIYRVNYTRGLRIVKENFAVRQAVVLQGVRMALVHSQRYLMRSQRSLKVASLRGSTPPLPSSMGTRARRFSPWNSNQRTLSVPRRPGTRLPSRW